MMHPHLPVQPRQLRWLLAIGLLSLGLGGLLVVRGRSVPPALRELPVLAAGAIVPLATETVSPTPLPSDTPWPPTPTPLPRTSTALPSATPLPPTSTAVPSATPLPPTSTPLPSTTPLPSATPICMDAWEPNDTAGQARPLPPAGVVRDLTLCPSGDVDAFRWTAGAGLHYIAQTFADPGLTPWLTITRDGQLVGQGPGAVGWDSLTPGTYLIQITNVAPGNPAGLSYILAVSATLLPSPVPATPTLISTSTPTSSPSVTPTPAPTQPPCLDAYEPDGIAAAAQPLLINDVPQPHLFCPAGDADWVWFAASRAKTYTIRTLNPSGGAAAPGVDPYLYLLDTDGQTVIDQNDDSGGGTNARLDFTPQRDGRYYVQVKNKGEVGAPGAAYALQITLAGLGGPTPSPVPLGTPGLPPALLTPTGAPAPTLVPPTPGVPGLPAPPSAPPGGPSATATIDPLLHILSGNASTGGLAYLEAGSEAALTADSLEAHAGLPTNDSWQQATPLDVGILYRHLNFVPVGYLPQLPPDTQPADHDFYTWRAKPGVCYLLGTSALTPGLDTTLQVLRVAPFATPEPLAGSDDHTPGSPDVASVARLCSTRDEWLIAAVNLYGWMPRTEMRGRTYDFAIVLDPPSPTPTRTPRPTPPPVVPPPVVPPPVVPPPVVPPPVVATPRPLPTLPPVLPVATAGPTTSLPGSPGGPRPPDPTASAGVPLSPTPSGSLLPSATSTVRATATLTITPVPQAVADLICYVDFNQNHAPDPGEEIVGLPGLVVDTITNQVIAQGHSDTVGRLHLVWPASQRVRLILPTAGPGWSHELGPGDLQHDPGDLSGTAHWQQNVEITPLLIPGVIPATSTGRTK